MFPIKTDYTRHDHLCQCQGCQGLCQDEYEYQAGIGPYAKETEQHAPLGIRDLSEESEIVERLGWIADALVVQNQLLARIANALEKVEQR